jgi:hypothetical protein
LIKIEIKAIPAKGKLVEFEQSINNLRDFLNGDCPNLKILYDKNSNTYLFSLINDSREELLETLNYYSVTLLFGAIQALSESTLFILNGKTTNLPVINYLTITGLKELKNL